MSPVVKRKKKQSRFSYSKCCVMLWACMLNYCMHTFLCTVVALFKHMPSRKHTSSDGMNFLREARAILPEDRSGSPERSTMMTPLSLTSDLSPSGLWWTNQTLTRLHKTNIATRHVTDSKTKHPGRHQNMLFSLLPHFGPVKFTGKCNSLTNGCFWQIISNKQAEEITEYFISSPTV